MSPAPSLNRWHRIGDATSQWLNVFLFNGDPNESISGRSYREGWRAKWWIDSALGFGHCRGAFVADLERAKLSLLAHGDIVAVRVCDQPRDRPETGQ
jgi:hypothetical protein